MTVGTKSIAGHFRRLLFSPYRGVCTILLYHHVVPESFKRSRLDGHLYVSEREFERQLRYLTDNRTVLSIEEMADRLEAGEPFPPDSVVLTFDDGHLDNLEYAHPLLNEYGVPATIYIATRFPNGDGFLWRHELHHLIEKNEALTFRYGGTEYDYDLTTKELSEQCFRDLSALFVRLQLSERRSLIDRLFARSGTDRPGREDRFLTWGQIEKLDRTGLVTIGSHTRNHVMLSRLDEEGARSEIQSGKEDLEKRLDHSVDYFSYPYGKANAAGPREFHLAKEVGFRNAVTTRFAHVHRAHARNQHALPRLSIDGTTTLDDLERYLTGSEAFRIQRGRRVVTD